MPTIIRWHPSISTQMRKQTIIYCLYQCFHTWPNLNPIESNWISVFNIDVFKTRSEYDNLLIALQNYANAMILDIFVCVQRIILNFDCPYVMAMLTLLPFWYQLTPVLWNWSQGCYRNGLNFWCISTRLNLVPKSAHDDFQGQLLFPKACIRWQ